ncbi:MAG: type V CRISPR-associated protein Cas12a/Cpf1 [Planctomycetaceae bacterium]|jgi:CRISPR-associated protein Cpf1|nr:type V CRISPR-associated protein Cas12a/Cpf1 [Planctomycetaceae bacterium]
MKNFTNLYQLSKMLRFELRPIGKTRKYIEDKGFLSEDEQFRGKSDVIRAKSYEKVKNLIDNYHKNFIENSLLNVQLTIESLNEYFQLFRIKNKDDIQKDTFEKIQIALRKQITKVFDTNKLFRKELIKEDLLNFVENKEDKELVKEFKLFTTYFKGFHENRKNMYTDEKKSTAIAYRLINDNLPKFINNIAVFEKIKTLLDDDIQKTFTKLKKKLSAFSSVTEFFEIKYYSNFLTQSQIDQYNTLIGGIAEEGNTKIQGLNECINLYNQQQREKKNRLPKFTPLFKQILSDRKSMSWLPEKFVNDNDVLKSIENLYQDMDKNVFNKEIQGEYSLKMLLTYLDDFDLSKIYLKNNMNLTNISQFIYNDYKEISNLIIENLKKENPQKKNERPENYLERINKNFKSTKSFSVEYINNCIGGNLLVEYFRNLEKTDTQDDLFSLIQNNYESIKNILNEPYPENKSLISDTKNIELIKQLLDNIKRIIWFVKPFSNNEESDQDLAFYAEFDNLWEKLDKFTAHYNMIRNYVTQKPYSTEKVKLNFDNSTLLAGWDVNKERDNTSVILRKNDQFYLVIIDKEHNRVFESNEANGKGYEKIEYKFLPGPNKMLPKVFFSKSRIDEFNPSKKLLENYKNETHKKGEHFNIQDCRELIDFYKKSIEKHEDWKKFDFQFSDTSTYQDLSGFYQEVEQQGYKITFRNISENYINRLVHEGKIYLFQIYNKDFSPYSKGIPNIHTLYWKKLFEQENLQNVVYKLNGEAEVFYRKKSIKDKNIIVHKANIPIDNKNKLNDKSQSCFNYDIIKDRRYTADKFQFHVPITLNFKASGNNFINEKVNQYIKDGNIKHIIGIDRGERHLLYLSLIDLNGNIKEQCSLNEIDNEVNEIIYKTDYHDLLQRREDERDQARKSWQTIESIKELKEGYLSQVIHKITQMMIEHNAIVVLEDLNFGFIRGRQKVEKQVYQKFERMLIDKLNYLVDKKKPAAEIGGLLNAYQLTNKFKSFKELGKQSGFLFYIPAWNTSNIDPVTGFVNMFNTRYTNVENAKEFFDKFADIRYNNTKNYFEFVVDDYRKFNVRAEDTRLNWIICTNGDRIRRFKNSKINNQWDYETISLTDKLTGLLKEFFNDYETEIKNLKESILKQTEKSFFEQLLYLFKLTLQMRNNIPNENVDYILSPIADIDGEFFDSRKGKFNLPDNADANGAYNIARKGLWVIDQIKNSDNLKKINLAISNKEWLKYAQK